MDIHDVPWELSFSFAVTKNEINELDIYLIVIYFQLNAQGCDVPVMKEFVILLESVYVNFIWHNEKVLLPSNGRTQLLVRLII